MSTKKKVKADKCKLTSTSLVHAPGVVRYAENLAIGNEKQAREIIASWNDDPRIADKIIAGEYSVEGDSVIVVLQEEE